VQQFLSSRALEERGHLAFITYVEEKNLDVEGDGKLTARMERLPYRQELDPGR